MVLELTFLSAYEKILIAMGLAMVGDPSAMLGCLKRIYKINNI